MYVHIYIVALKKSKFKLSELTRHSCRISDSSDYTFIIYFDRWLSYRKFFPKKQTDNIYIFMCVCTMYVHFVHIIFKIFYIFTLCVAKKLNAYSTCSSSLRMPYIGRAEMHNWYIKYQRYKYDINNMVFAKMFSLQSI